MSPTKKDTIARVDGFAPPWAGIADVYAPEGMSIDKLMDKAGLTYGVARVPVAYFLPDETQPRFMSGKFVTVRTDNGNALGVGGNRRDELALTELRDFCQIVAGMGARPVAAVNFDGGSKVSVQLEREPFTVGPDTILDYVAAHTSFDGVWPTSLGFLNFVQVCCNTVALAQRTTKKQVSARHTIAQRDRLAIAIQSLAEHDAHLEQIKANIAAMLRQKVAQRTALQIFEQLFPLPEDENKRGVTVAEKLRDLASDIYNGATIADKRGTAWGVYNVATEITNHHVVRRNTEGNTAEQNRAFALMFGTDTLAARTADILAALR